MGEFLNATIIGAGPYGLAAAAHFRSIAGFDFRIFGEPMEFWQKKMPAGMFLRSPWEASHIADPTGALSLNAYTAARNSPLPAPIPLDRFIDYGNWFQQQAVLNVDRRKVRVLKVAPGGFTLELEDGETVRTRCVVVAAGIAPFAWRPPEFNELPPHLASHSSDQSDLRAFAGRRLLVVGAGQSALESAALLHEAGANVELVVRQPKVRWLRWRNRLYRKGLLGKLLYSERDVGPAGISQLVARPDLFKKLPRGVQEKIGRRSIRPAGAAWLIDRVKDVPIHTNLSVKTARQENGHLNVILNDGTGRKCDHLLFATGYRIDVSKYRFLPPELLSRIDCTGGYPRLRSGLESSVAGLYFLGAPAAWSFGPVARFVSGSYYCVRALVRKIGQSA